MLLLRRIGPFRRDFRGGLHGLANPDEADDTGERMKGNRYYTLMGSRGANPGISKRRLFGRLLPGHPSKLWMTHVAYALSPWSARRIVEEERWIRAIRAHTEVKCLVKVERGGVWGSGVCVDSEVHHKVLIVKAIAEPTH